MDLSNYTFRVDYSDGLKFECFDLKNKSNFFKVRVYLKIQKSKHNLIYNYNSAGAKWVEEELVNNEIFDYPWAEIKCKSGMWHKLAYRGYVPYRIEFIDFETDKIVHREEFDARHKLVNFYLHSQDPNTLHTWMCAIEKFKKEHNCQISIINDYLKDNQNYSFVDSYWKAEENFIRYYAGFGIGRFGSENVPDLNKNPDGIKGKNDLEIIEDILYHYSKKL